LRQGGPRVCRPSRFLPMGRSRRSHRKATIVAYRPFYRDENMKCCSTYFLLPSLPEHSPG
jgi:hypothetical protein